MKPGFAFSVMDGASRVGVIYTSHFTEQYHLPYKYRPAVQKFISEDKIRAGIEEAILEIAEYQAGDPNLQGIIMAPDDKLNMTFSVRARHDGFTMNMVNIMIKQGYIRSGPRDYIIKINPTYKISFERSIDQEIRVAALEYIGQHVEEFEDGGFYTTDTGLITFGAERNGDAFVVDFAGWNVDMLYVTVK